MVVTLQEDMLEDAMSRIARDVDALFESLLPVPEEKHARLVEAMRYAAIGGGKRLRPLLLVTTAEMFKVDHASAMRAACAIEAIHVYSLIHDDLPCMDDDDMRHGKATVHKAFDEATAVLAGDSLHALAFAILADERTSSDPFVRSELVHTLALASGSNGMAGGQMIDMMAEAETFDLHTITRLQQLKTGALLGAAVEMGAILGRAPPEGRVGLRAYARDIGLAFQIADDLLDHDGDESKAGKALRKDMLQGKQTFLSLLGPERARKQARMLVKQAAGHLVNFGEEADVLRALADYVIERDH